MEPYGDNFIPLIPVDAIIHTLEYPFCLDQTCPCKEDQELILTVAQHVVDGLLTSAEANQLVAGKTL